jgi:hypothetical protein
MVLIVNFSPTTVGRIAFSAILFFLVFRGNRIAGNILALSCAFIAHIVLNSAIAAFANNTLAAFLYSVIAGLLASLTLYLFFSPAVCAFQGRPFSSPLHKR